MMRYDRDGYDKGKYDRPGLVNRVLYPLTVTLGILRRAVTFLVQPRTACLSAIARCTLSTATRAILLSAQLREDYQVLTDILQRTVTISAQGRQLTLTATPHAVTHSEGIRVVPGIESRTTSLATKDMRNKLEIDE
jgi:hypothetical protein